MVKINESLSDTNTILYSNKNSTDASISGYKFLINYFLNLELPFYNKDTSPNSEDCSLIF